MKRWRKKGRGPAGWGSGSGTLVLQAARCWSHNSDALGAEWKGRPFLFSRGCSFYHCKPDPQRPEQIQIVYGRYCMEPATKPGELALVAIRGVTWILERFPSLADRWTSRPAMRRPSTSR